MSSRGNPSSFGRRIVLRGRGSGGQPPPPTQAPPTQQPGGQQKRTLDQAQRGDANTGGRPPNEVKAHRVATDTQAPATLAHTPMQTTAATQPPLAAMPTINVAPTIPANNPQLAAPQLLTTQLPSSRQPNTTSAQPVTSSQQQTAPSSPQPIECEFRVFEFGGRKNIAVVGYEGTREFRPSERRLADQLHIGDEGVGRFSLAPNFEGGQPSRAGDLQLIEVVRSAPSQQAQAAAAAAQQREQSENDVRVLLQRQMWNSIEIERTGSSAQKHFIYTGGNFRGLVLGALAICEGMSVGTAEDHFYVVLEMPRDFFSRHRDFERNPDDQGQDGRRVTIGGHFYVSGGDVRWVINHLGPVT